MPPTLPDDNKPRYDEVYPLKYEKREVYEPIDVNTYFIAYSADSSLTREHTVAITASSMDAALGKWAGQFSDLHVHARSIFKYQPYYAITKVYKVNQTPVLEWTTGYKVVY